jgi:peptidyl-prolyl cis-trans isomerase A (cyclophilin A)
MKGKFFTTVLPVAAACLAAPVLLAGQGAAPKAGGTNQALLNPAALKETAPAKYSARFDTNNGTFVIDVHRDWAPNGADRFYNLVKSGFYTDCRFFRVVPGFMVQWGINGDPAVMNVWRGAQIPRDPVKQSNKRGMVSFAQGASPDTRTTQVFVNFNDQNAALDAQGFAPFGEVSTDDMTVVDGLYDGYGEGPPSGKGPDQGRMQTEGNAYLIKSFPKLNYIKKASIR